jgi:plasmid stabilization system protein ParE
VPAAEVELSEQARAQIRAIDIWWRENRQRSPDLFGQEVDKALQTLADTATPGVLYDDRKSVRRLLLERSHYHLYFTRQADVQYVVAVWSAFRGRGPSLL